MKRVFIIHGWGGKPAGWLLWLKEELGKKGFEASTLEMPNSEKPEIEEWVGYLSEQAGEVDKDTYFVGHSIGCQTILRFLEKLPEDKTMQRKLKELDELMADVNS